jgi:hypothetical protein
MSNNQYLIYAEPAYKSVLYDSTSGKVAISQLPIKVDANPASSSLYSRVDMNSMPAFVSDSYDANGIIKLEKLPASAQAGLNYRGTWDSTKKFGHPENGLPFVGTYDVDDAKSTVTMPGASQAAGCKSGDVYYKVGDYWVCGIGGGGEESVPKAGTMEKTGKFSSGDWLVLDYLTWKVDHWEGSFSQVLGDNNVQSVCGKVGNVTFADIVQASFITEAKLGTGAVTTSKIYDYSVDASKIATGAVETRHIKDAAVTGAK